MLRFHQRLAVRHLTVEKSHILHNLKQNEHMSYLHATRFENNSVLSRWIEYDFMGIDEI